MSEQRAGAIVALDYVFDDDRVESVSYGSATTLLDFETAIWDPSEILSGYYDYDGYRRTYPRTPISERGQLVSHRPGRQASSR